MKYSHEIIKSEDGSNTLFVPELNETYHSTHGAVQEARHVFFKMGLDFLLDKGYKSVSVFEIGFGTGLNAILAYEYALENNIEISYTTIEAFPVNVELADKLNYFEFIDIKYQPIFYEMHSCEWELEHQLNEGFIFSKHQIKLEDVQSLRTKKDIVFFDAFAPSRQAEMWTVEQLERVRNQMNTISVLVTYCANGQFKRNLKQLDFKVTGVPGPPGKREMTRAFLGAM